MRIWNGCCCLLVSWIMNAFWMKFRLFFVYEKYTLTLCLFWNSIHNTSDAFRWIDELLYGDKNEFCCENSVCQCIATLRKWIDKKFSVMFGTRTHHALWMNEICGRKCLAYIRLHDEKSIRYGWRDKLESGWLSEKSNWNGALLTRVQRLHGECRLTIELVPILFVKNKNTLCHLQWNVTNSARIEIMPFDEIRSVGDFKGDQHNRTLAVAWHC